MKNSESSSFGPETAAQVFPKARPMSYLASLLRPNRWAVGLAVLGMILDSALTLLRPWPLKVVIDRVLSAEPRPTRLPLIGEWLNRSGLDSTLVLYGACLATLLIALGTGALTYGYTRMMGRIGKDVVFELRRRLFAHLQRLSLRFHDGQRTGDLVTRLTSDVQALQDVLANGIIVLFGNVILLAGMLALMLWLNARFACIALAASPLLLWVLFRSTRRVREAARAARKSDGMLASVAQETLSSIRIVQGLSQEPQQDGRFHLLNLSSLEAYLEGSRQQARIAPLVDFLAAVGLVLVMACGAQAVRAGEMTTGDVVVFFAYVTNLYSPMKALAKLSYGLQKAAVAIDRIVQVLRVEREVADAEDATPAPRLRGEIEFEGVSFEYQPGRPILDGINLKIVRGEKVALVGASGAGKSSLVSLIPRLYDPSTGLVRIDGQDIRRYRLGSLRDQISLVLQDSLLFSGTIRENIAFGKPGAGDEEIVAAARTAFADEFIDRLPDGYDTPVSERGSTLSGGQRQRIAIARAVLRDAPILILDEPTSGLDAASERIVLEALRAASVGRTTIIISHRLLSLQFVDRVIEMDHGRVGSVGAYREYSEALRPSGPLPLEAH